MLSWQICSREFAIDGSLRDIYVECTTVDDWQRLLDLVRVTYQYEFSYESTPTQLPVDATAVFALPNFAAASLGITIGEVLIHCHSFWIDEMEMTIDPKQVRDARNFDVLQKFIGSLGAALQRDVLVTHENCKELPILRYAWRSQQIEFLAAARSWEAG